MQIETNQNTTQRIVLMIINSPIKNLSSGNLRFVVYKSHLFCFLFFPAFSSNRLILSMTWICESHTLSKFHKSFLVHGESEKDKRSHYASNKNASRAFAWMECGCVNSLQQATDQFDTKLLLFVYEKSSACRKRTGSELLRSETKRLRRVNALSERARARTKIAAAAAAVTEPRVRLRVFVRQIGCSSISWRAHTVAKWAVRREYQRKS